MQQMLPTHTHELCGRNAENEGENGEKIMQRTGEITLGQINAEQQNVARLSICENLITLDI